MKIQWFTLLVFLLVAHGSMVQAGFGQASSETWTSIGPEGGVVTTLAIDPLTPTTLYAYSDSVRNIYKSTDGGGSWSATNAASGSSSSVRGVIAIDPLTPATLYAGTFPISSVIKSVDGGETWARVNRLSLPSIVNCLVVDPITPTTIYAGVNQGTAGVLKSTDGGVNWVAADNGLPKESRPGDFTFHLAIDPTNPSTIYAGVQSLSGTPLVFKTRDGGQSWSSASDGLPSRLSGSVEIAIDPVNSAAVYLGTGQGVYKSTDGGDSWNITNSPGTVYGIAIDATGTTVYAATRDYGIYKSPDGGDSWVSANAGLPNLIMLDVAIDPLSPATVYAATNGFGVFKSQDGGNSWEPAYDDLPGGSVLAVAVDPPGSNLYVTTQVATGVFKSSDGGNSWSFSNASLPATGFSVFPLAIDPVTPTTLYTATGPRTSLSVRKSTDGGVSWSAANAGLPAANVLAIAIDPAFPTTLYAGTSFSGLYTSTNGGNSWTANIGLPATSSVTPIIVDPGTHTTLYAAALVGRSTSVFKSIDAGDSWAPATAGLPDPQPGPPQATILALAIDPTTPTTLYAGTRFNGVYKSIDGGNFWNAVNTGLPADLQISALAIDPNRPATVYAGTNGVDGVYRSTDGGNSWTVFNAGLARSPFVSALTTDRSGSTYLGASDGVFVITSPTSPLSCTGTGSSRLRAVVKGKRKTGGIAGVTLTLAGPAACRDSAETKASGRYAFRTLGAGTYTVTPALEGCTFTPPERVVTIDTRNVRAQFRAICP